MRAVEFFSFIVLLTGQFSIGCSALGTSEVCLKASDESQVLAEAGR